MTGLSNFKKPAASKKPIHIPPGSHSLSELRKKRRNTGLDRDVSGPREDPPLLKGAGDLPFAKRGFI